MTFQGWFLIILFTAVLLALTKPMGLWLTALFEGRRTPLHVVLGPIERGFYALAGIDPAAEQSWRRYAVHMLLFNAAMALFTYLILRVQYYLPLNAPKFAGSGRTAHSTSRSASPPIPTGNGIRARRRCRTSARCWR